MLVVHHEFFHRAGAKCCLVYFKALSTQLLAAQAAADD